MFHKIVSAIGFGILGADPITALYLIGMGTKKDKKSNIALFWSAYMGFSILIGALLSSIFGLSAGKILSSLMPADDSPFWVVLELVLSIVVLVFVTRKLFYQQENSEEKKEVPTEERSPLKYIISGFLFAISCFTDPTYYAVIVLGGASANFFTTTLLLTIWFVTSQAMAIIVYLAIQMNFLRKLLDWVEKLQEKGLKTFMRVVYVGLFVLAVFMMINSAYCLVMGEYLF